MAAKRTTAVASVDALRSEVHEYHVAVTQALTEMKTNCKHCHEQVTGLDLQVNGEKPERDDAPSMCSDIKSLKQSRNSLRRGVQVAWAVLIGLGGIVASMFTFKSKW
jgi:hypothetical protein